MSVTLHENPISKEQSMKRLGKRLAYLLRYSATKEGLEVDDNSFVELKHLCKTRLLQKYSETEVLEAITSSRSYKHTKRYECKEKGNGQIYVRAAYLRNFEKSPFHKDTKVKTLFESSMRCVLDNLDDFDLEDFPEEHILSMMIRRFKQEKKLNYKTLCVLLAPTIRHLDLEGVFLNNNILRLVWSQCPHLQALSLRDCSYIVTDVLLAQITKNLPCLEKLNLCLCTHLTNKSLVTLAKNLPRLNTLHITCVPSLTAQGVLEFLQKAPALKFLDVYFLRTTPEEHELLIEIATRKKITFILKGLRSGTEEVTREDLDYFFRDGEDDYDESDQSSNAQSTDAEDSDFVYDEENDEYREYEEQHEPSSGEDDKILLDGLLNEIWSDEEELE